MTHFDPTEAIGKIPDRGSFVPQVLELLYRKRHARKARLKNGAALYFKTEGQGPVVLLIGPLGADSSFWSRQAPELARHFQVVTFDHRGSGESSECEESWSTEKMANDAIELLGEMKVNSAHVIGVALGGLVAQQIAKKLPNMVERLVLVSSYLQADEQIALVTAKWRSTASAVGMERLFDDTLDSLFSEEYLAQERGEFGELQRLKAFYRLTLQKPRDFCLQSLAGVHHAPVDVSSITAATLVIHGSADKLVSPTHGTQLAGQITGSRLILMSGAPHFLTWERHEAFNEAVISFLKNPLQPQTLPLEWKEN